MAAATVATSSKTVFGDHAISMATLTSVADTYTWASGLAFIEKVDVSQSGKVSAVGCTWSGGTVTFAIEGAETPNLSVVAIGY